MNLSKIGDDPQWRKVGERMAQLRTNPTLETMARLQTSQASVKKRKSEIELALSAMAGKKSTSAWQAALEGDNRALEKRDALREEYRSLEQTERFNEAALEEGKQALDFVEGRVCLQICQELKPDYVKAVVPKAQAAARAMLEAMEIDRAFIEQLLRCDVRIDHLGRISFPRMLNRESLEAFLKEIAELG